MVALIAPHAQARNVKGDEYKGSDAMVVVGFAFNGDDGHINGLFRELLDEHGKKIVVICIKGDKTDDEVKKDYQ